MALNNNLVLAKKDHAALAEALAQRQPGDRLVFNNVEVKVVENLTDRASFDVVAVGSATGGRSEPEEVEATPLAQTVLGVMSGKKTSKS